MADLLAPTTVTDLHFFAAALAPQAMHVRSSCGGREPNSPWSCDCVRGAAGPLRPPPGVKLSVWLYMETVRTVGGAGALGAALDRGMRPIFSVLPRATGVHFHQHAGTWFALTHGTKVWWLGRNEDFDALVGAAADASGAPVSPCSYLGHPPPRSRVVVQRAGEVLFFGEGVLHATCAVETSIGVGNQMGFYHTPWVDVSSPPLSSSGCKNGTALCPSWQRARTASCCTGTHHPSVSWTAAAEDMAADCTC